MYTIGEMVKITGLTSHVLRSFKKRKEVKTHRRFSKEELEYIISLKIENFKGELKRINDFEEYFCDSEGNIYHNKFNYLYKMKLEKHKTGYLYIRFRTNKKNKRFRVHRIIAEHFIPNPENKLYVNHKNGIKSDNFVENLEWVTASENTKRAFDLGFAKNKKGFEDSQSIQVEVFDKDMALIKICGSIKEASKEFEADETTISRRIKQNQKKPYKNKYIFLKHCSATTIENINVTSQEE